MSTPGAEPSTKTVRVSLQTHTAINDLAAKLGGSVDDALRHLMGESTVRVPVSTVQRDRWELAAQRSGVSLPEYAAMAVECQMRGVDRATINQIWHIVRAIGINTGSIPQDPPAPSTDPARPHPLAPRVIKDLPPSGPQ